MGNDSPDCRLHKAHCYAQVHSLALGSSLLSSSPWEGAGQLLCVRARVMLLSEQSSPVCCLSIKAVVNLLPQLCTSLLCKLIQQMLRP